MLFHRKKNIRVGNVRKAASHQNLAPRDHTGGGGKSRLIPSDTCSRPSIPMRFTSATRLPGAAPRVVTGG